MSLAKVEKVQILASAEWKMPLLAALQAAGLVHLREAVIGETDLRLSEPDASGHEELLGRLKKAADLLSSWDERGAMSRMLAAKPVVVVQDSRALLETDYLLTLETLERLVAGADDIKSMIAALEKEVDLCLPFRDLDIPVAEIHPAESVDIRLGTLPLAGLEALENLAVEAGLWFHVVSMDRRSCSLLVLLSRMEREEIEANLRDLQFSPFSPPESVFRKAQSGERISDVIEKDRREVGELKSRLDGLTAEMRALFPEREHFIRIHDLVRNQHEREMSRRFLAETERAVLLEGWIKSSDAAKLRNRLEPFADALEIFISPPAEGEDPPVVLENTGVIKPFEIITRLYGLPQRGSLDPTFFLAPFFFLFVGLCVSEAGYGAVVTLLCLLYLKFGKPRGGRRLFARLMLYLGISNIIFGTLVGGWFGFSFRKLMVLDPLKDPVPFLVLSLALGFIQVWFGTLLSAIDGIRNRDYTQSIFVKGGWLLLLPSLVVYGITGSSSAGALSLAGAAGVVFFAAPNKNPLARFFGGLYSLYGISAYLGDTLSYSRILALGLSTGVIAMVVNTLCGIALGIPWVGWILAALIFAGGHLFNLAIGFLGGFVHSMRLQFVEFFNKFIRTGGRPFKPFTYEGQFVDFE